MRNYWRNGNIKDCCACGACENICPKRCIKMEKNEEGFLYPTRDPSSCIECGLCEKVCPFSDNYTFQTTNSPSVYAAYDINNRSGSSSGGIFFSLAKYIIENQSGWVFGAAFDDSFQLHHEGVHSMEDLSKLRGSKYVQSTIGHTYTNIKGLLDNNEQVLFVGTPCQVAGLRGFLRKQYDNLLLVDLVCHGVPPQTLFDEHVRYLEQKHKAKLVSYSFRKADGWGGCEIADFANPKKHKELPSYSLSPYLYSFMQAYTYRESCYDCKFAQIPRQGDITLADFWGAENFFAGIDITKGVSLVLTNTEKGELYFERLKSCCVVHQSNIKDAATYNANLVTRTKRPELRNYIFAEIRDKGYKKITNTVFRVNNYYILKIKLWLLSLPLVNRF